MTTFINITVEWHNTTFIFYILVIILSFFIPKVTYSKREIVIKTESGRKIQVWSFICFLLLLFVKGFSSTGRDLRAGYYYNFNSAVSLNAYRDQSIEFGYKLLGVVVRRFTDNYAIFIFIISVLTILPILKLLEKYQKQIDVSSSLLLYTSIFFFTGFSAHRVALAASIGLIGFDAMIEKKFIKSFIWIIIASTFHVSALVLLIPFVFVAAKGISRRMLVVGMLLLFVVVYALKDSISTFMLSSDRYFYYGINESIGLGMEQIIYFLPLFILYNWGKESTRNNEYINKISTAILSTAFMFGMLSYVIPIFGRFKDIFLPIIFIVPFYVKTIKVRHPKMKGWIDIFIIIYCIFRFWMYISQYYKLEDIMPYTNFFGWTI